MSRARSGWQVADYRARRWGLSAARLIRWRLQPERWPAPERESARDAALVVRVHEERVALTRTDAHADAALEAGKQINVALAAPAFDGLVVSAERPLSFWRALGRVTQARGYTWGMELRGGCVVPSIAGGLCLLSNALFALAVRAGWRIVERHGHSLEAIAPREDELPLDATVAWPDVDLVVAPRAGRQRLHVAVESTPRGPELVVAAFAEHAPTERITLEHSTEIVTRGAKRFRRTRITRRIDSLDGTRLWDELVADGERRVLEPEELGRTCITCGEDQCRDRPAEPVLVALRRRGTAR